jgi:hypothetical protein
MVRREGIELFYSRWLYLQPDKFQRTSDNGGDPSTLY